MSVFTFPFNETQNIEVIQDNENIIVKLISKITNNAVRYDFRDIFPDFRKQNEEYQKIWSVNDDILIYCEHKDLEVSFKNKIINEEGDLFIYCYDFKTNKSIKLNEKINYYVSNITPFRENDKIKYVSHEYYPAGSWKRIVTL
jgi:hypothetical protein